MQCSHKSITVYCVICHSKTVYSHGDNETRDYLGDLNCLFTKRWMCEKLLVHGSKSVTMQPPTTHSQQIFKL